MATAILQRPGYLFLIAASLIFILDTVAVRTIPAAKDPILVYAVLFDFMLVIPFFYWLFMLRAKGTSIAKIAPLPLLGAAAAWVALPAPLRSTFWHSVWPIEAALLVAEAAFIGYELRTVYRLIRSFRNTAKRKTETGEALRIAIYEEVGKGALARYLLHDLSVFYYLLCSWGKTRSTNEDSAAATRFTYSRKTGQTLYAAVITKVILLEGLAMHLFLQQWSHLAAWIMTAADLWLLALIWADSRASFLRPIELTANRLKLRYGLRIQADVPIAAIAAARYSTEYHPEKEEQRESALPVLSTPNVRIELTQPLQVEGILFQPRTVTRIYLALDEPRAFVEEIERLRATDQ